MNPRNRRKIGTVVQVISDDIRSTNRFIADMRRVDEALASVQEVLDEGAIDDRIFQTIERCTDEIKRLPPEDPKHVSSRYELRFVTSWPYRMWLRFTLGLERMVRIAGRELLHACIIPLKLILILILHVIAFLLVWWILFSF